MTAPKFSEIRDAATNAALDRHLSGARARLDQVHAEITSTWRGRILLRVAQAWVRVTSR